LELSFGALIPIHFSIGNKAESQTTTYVSKCLWNTHKHDFATGHSPTQTQTLSPPFPYTHTHTHTHIQNSTPCRYIPPLRKMTKMRNPNSPKRAHNASDFKDKCLKKVDGQTC